MQVNELKNDRIKLERDLCDKIGEMLVAFQVKTGVMVSDLELTVREFNTVTGQRTVFIESAKVQLDV